MHSTQVLAAKEVGHPASYVPKKHLDLMRQRNFRETLGLIDGSIVEVQIGGDETWWTTGI
jgi:hypothetical protein